MISIDVDLDDIISSLDRFDRKEMMKAFQEDGYIPKECKICSDGSIEMPSVGRTSLSQDDFNKALQKLFDNGWKLSLEEENYIIKLGNRF